MKDYSHGLSWFLHLSTNKYAQIWLTTYFCQNTVATCYRGVQWLAAGLRFWKAFYMKILFLWPLRMIMIHKSIVSLSFTMMKIFWNEVESWKYEITFKKFFRHHWRKCDRMFLKQTPLQNCNYYIINPFQNSTTLWSIFNT